jgi:methyl-accepting chemotaxis protein
MMAQIASATNEQAATTEELNHSLNEIAQLVARSAAAAHESSDACADLSRLYEQMHGQLSQFRLPSSEQGGEQRFRREPSAGWSFSPATGD